MAQLIPLYATISKFQTGHAISAALSQLLYLLPLQTLLPPTSSLRPLFLSDFVLLCVGLNECHFCCYCSLLCSGELAAAIFTFTSILFMSWKCKMEPSRLSAELMEGQGHPTSQPHCQMLPLQCKSHLFD